MSEISDINNLMSDNLDDINLITQTQTIRPVVKISAHRADVIKLLNLEHWRSILDYTMPRIVSVSIRTSRIQGMYVLLNQLFCKLINKIIF